MAPTKGSKSPVKGPKKRKNLGSNSGANPTDNPGPLEPAGPTPSSPKKSKKSSSKNPSSKTPKGKKSVKRSLIKNLGFRKVSGSDKSGSKAIPKNAPWFSSLVREVASVLGKSPIKRKSSDNGHNVDDDLVEGSIMSDQGSDYYVDFEDEDYYRFDERDPDIPDSADKNNKGSNINPESNLKDDFITFVENFVSSHKSQTGPNSYNSASKKTSRFMPPDAEEVSFDKHSPSIRLFFCSFSCQVLS